MSETRSYIGLGMATDRYPRSMGQLGSGDIGRENRFAPRLAGTPELQNAAELWQVKNTFIHVEDTEMDVPGSMQRSKSDSDLSRSSSMSARSSSLIRSYDDGSSSIDDRESASERSASIEPSSFGNDDAGEPEEKGEWSEGSAKHDVGQCRPCLYYRTKPGCRNGRECPFCHLPHERNHKARPCKAKRNRCKQIAAMYDDAHSGDPQQIVDEVRRRTAESGASETEQSYILSIIASRAKNSEERLERPDPSRPGSSNQYVRDNAARLWKMAL